MIDVALTVLPPPDPSVALRQVIVAALLVWAFGFVIGYACGVARAASSVSRARRQAFTDRVDHATLTRLVERDAKDRAVEE